MPFQVVRALGDGALNLNGSMTMPTPRQEGQDSGASSSKASNSNNRYQQEISASDVAPSSSSGGIGAHQRIAAEPATSAQRQGQSQGQEAKQGCGEGAAIGDGEEDEAGGVLKPGVNGGGVLSTPSLEHSRRWEDIDRLLVAAAPAHNSSNSAASAPFTEAEASTGGSQGKTACSLSGASNGTQSPAMSSSSSSAAAPAATAAVAGVAKKYPLLFAATRANEDVMMAAARLLASHEEDGGGATCTDGAVVRQAIAFLEEEVAASEDGGASVWQVSGAVQGTV